MSNDIVIWEEKKLNEIKKLFAPELSDNEFQIYCQIGRQTGLNPFLREIWAVKYNGPASIFIGRDGYRKSAQSSPLYDWHMVEAIYENDEFSGKNGEYTHTFKMKDRGKIVGAYALCQRKGSSRPNYVRVDMSEYNTGRSVWAQKPSTMIKKVAEAQVLRMTFQELFAGTYDESEQWEEEGETKLSPPKKSAPQKQTARKVVDITQESEDDESDEDITDLRDETYSEFIEKLSKVKSTKDLGSIWEDIKANTNNLGQVYLDDLTDHVKQIKSQLEKQNEAAATKPASKTPAKEAPKKAAAAPAKTPAPAKAPEPVEDEVVEGEIEEEDEDEVQDDETTNVVDHCQNLIDEIRATATKEELDAVMVKVDNALAKKLIQLRDHGVLHSHKNIRLKKSFN